ncbi:hypothetical protein V6N11_041574 [Hibiscus sabdariffa]|uniref:Uncharacterized protein n=1 Tax=Hibiscus sabdariffa TaxID=183260 RepID=A0ABR2RKU8_9ROSI
MQSESGIRYLPLISLYFFASIKYWATFLDSPMVTETPARAHLLGLVLAELENGASVLIQSARVVWGGLYINRV